MTYEEAIAYSLTVPWKIGYCSQGKRCWCRTIFPRKRVADKDDNEIYIAGSGEIRKEYAEHIVKLHNDSLK